MRGAAKEGVNRLFRKRREVWFCNFRRNPKSPFHKTTAIVSMKKLILPLAFALFASASQAATIYFDLVGVAGVGLLPGNEPGSITGGTGGEIGAGIFYDDVTNVLTVNVGWGSSQGFTNLSSLANNSHIHGPTPSVNGNGFFQTAGVLINLTRSSNAVTGGIITNSVLDFDSIFGVNAEAREADLRNGKFYINIHTANNPGGEMRGFLVEGVPEPSTSLLGLLAVGPLFLRRRRA